MRCVMKILIVVCLLIAVTQCQIINTNFLNDIFSNINHQLQTDIQNHVRDVQQKINDNVRNELSKVDQLLTEIRQRPIPLPSSGQTIIVNGGSRSSHTVLSGTTPDGEPYFRDIEDRVDGNILHRTETIYNPKLRSMEKYHYTLDLTKPNAKPVLVSDTIEPNGNY
ncbi:hypothetical protein G9C98_002089 [Cotesia typhae]|uniref:Uncharacterized protein n=1 Tax=Cotesia typhae TaxID=2053667 RepID=A0A8J5V123_9HYME|nr:hypothetical protein G9C98_002089 [Cotesia typhae]